MAKITGEPWRRDQPRLQKRNSPLSLAIGQASLAWTIFVRRWRPCSGLDRRRSSYDLELTPDLTGKKSRCFAKWSLRNILMAARSHQLLFPELTKDIKWLLKEVGNLEVRNNAVHAPLALVEQKKISTVGSTIQMEMHEPKNRKQYFEKGADLISCTFGAVVRALYTSYFCFASG